MPLFALALLVPALWGCAASGPPRETPALEPPGREIKLVPVDVLALSPEMEAFLDRYVRSYANPDTRVNLLARAVADTAILGFQYDSFGTFSAIEAFERRSGNCISYANLIVAMARAVNLEASYQEVILAPEWTPRGDMMLVPQHINVVIRGDRGTYLLDISGVEISPEDTRHRLTDAEALGLYHSNLGADALLEADLSLAYLHLARAIEMAPRRADPWINLGVVLGRNQQLDDAALAYQQALENDPAAISALANLYDVERKRGNVQAAAAVASRVERYRRQNPYYLMSVAEQAVPAPGDLAVTER